MSRQALGKGIRAIIPEETRSALAAEARPIGLDEIRPNPFQPRQAVEENLSELVASIKEKGVLQPVVVRRRRDGYELVMGERRVRAAKQAGLTAIPAVVRDADDRDMLELALIENVQRQDLNPIDEAMAYHRLVNEFKLKHEEVADRVGRSRAAVSNALRLLELPEEVRAELAAGRISSGHARALLVVPGRAERIELCMRIVSEGLSVRQIEAIGATKRPKRPRPAAGKDVFLQDLEDKLQERLGTRVRISLAGKQRGVIAIHFHSSEDLERVVRLIG